MGGGCISISDAIPSIWGRLHLHYRSPVKLCELSLRRSPKRLCCQGDFSWPHWLLSALLGASDCEIIAPRCGVFLFFFFWGYPIANPTKHLVMMDSGEIRGCDRWLHFRHFGAPFWWRFSQLSTTEKVKYQKASVSLHAKKWKIGVGIDANPRPRSFGIQMQTRAKWWQSTEEGEKCGASRVPAFH